MVPIVEIDIPLVRSLVTSQFPNWAALPIERDEPNGYDNRTFRLGPELSVRMPSHQRYAPQIEKEDRWLPRLAPLLPYQIPKPVALGVPDHGYPWHWSVNRWLEGESATVGQIDDLHSFADELARFLRALHQIDPEGGPEPGQHNFFRGGSLTVYDAETRAAIDALSVHLDRDTVTEVWEAALHASWQEAPVWVHGDLAASNLLVRDGHLSAVIDFGCSGVGDPACDLAIAWTLFSERSRKVFREGVALDASTWARGRGWTLWKGLIVLATLKRTGSAEEEEARRVVEAVVADHEAEA